MIASILCRVFGHRTMLLEGKEAWCSRCRRLWPLGPLVMGLLALPLAGCLRPLLTPDGHQSAIDELRPYLAKDRPLVAEAGKRCPLTLEPSACTTAAKELEASLADVEQVLHVAGACQNDNARVCLAGLDAAKTATRLPGRRASGSSKVRGRLPPQPPPCRPPRGCGCGRRPPRC